jgi:hypothetical protein
MYAKLYAVQVLRLPYRQQSYVAATTTRPFTKLVCRHGSTTPRENDAPFIDSTRIASANRQKPRKDQRQQRERFMGGVFVGMWCAVCGIVSAMIMARDDINLIRMQPPQPPIRQHETANNDR